MGKRNEQRARSVWSNVLITAAALIAGWATIALACKPYLAAGRAAINRELDHYFVPDDDLEERSPSRPKTPNDEAQDALEDLKNESSNSKHT